MDTETQEYEVLVTPPPPTVGDRLRPGRTVRLTRSAARYLLLKDWIRPVAPPPAPPPAKRSRSRRS